MRKNPGSFDTENISTSSYGIICRPKKFKSDNLTWNRAIPMSTETHVCTYHECKKIWDVLEKQGNALRSDIIREVFNHAARSTRIIFITYTYWHVSIPNTSSTYRYIDTNCNYLHNARISYICFMYQQVENSLPKSKYLLYCLLNKVHK